MGDTQTIDREHRLWDNFQAAYAVLYLLTWLIDSFFLNLTTFLADSTPLLVRLACSAIVMIPAVVLVYLSHELLFGGDGKPPDKVVDSGIFGRVRHPMYLGTLLVYLAVFLTTLSIACFVLFLIIVVIYDRAASFEEKLLIKLFGEEYLQYKKRVKKWLPL
ncbi:MAG: methyltransferase family protein [Candidatus Thorarchaeota archaeon]